MEVAGITYVGSQSKYVPYVIEVNGLGEAVAVGRAQLAAPADPRVVRASLASSRTAVDHGPHVAIREFNAQQARLMATEDAAEGLRSFVERRRGRFTGR